MPLWMRNRTNQVISGDHGLARLDIQLAVDRQVEFGEPRQPNVSATAALADPLPQFDERLRRYPKTIFVELQYDAGTFIRFDP